MDSAAEPRWQRPALVAIALLGIAISLYLTATHNGAVPLVCTVGSVVNCAAVTHSAYSVIPGTSIPVSVLGIGWFAVSGVLALVSAPRRGAPSPLWGGLGSGPLVTALAWSGIGLLVVLYLVFVEIVVLHQICEWCTVVHLLVVASFVVTLRRFQQSLPKA